VLTASCILSDINFPAFAVTEVETEALMVPTSFVNKWIAENTIWQKFIFSLVAKRLADVIEVVEEVAFKKLDSRIAKQLLYMGASNQNTIQITHQQLAGELGTSREVISRILKDFEHQGIIDVLRGKISILDRTKIKKIANVV
jgi:CRP/FNR family transcriptional regulator